MDTEKGAGLVLPVPGNGNAFVFSSTVTQVEVDQGLVRNAGFVGQVFKEGNRALVQPNRDLLLQP